MNGPTNLPGLDLPESLGRITSSFAGSRPFTFDLLATGCGHPREAESALLSVLEHRHAQRPFDWIFVDLDGVLGTAKIDHEADEVDVKAYRAFPNAEISKAIIGYLVRSSWTSAAWGFTVISQPQVHLRYEEEWFSWADSREALRLLDRHSVSIETTGALLTAVLGKNGVGGPLSRLFELLRLRWTAEEWQSHALAMQGLDVRSALQDKGARIPALTSMAAKLTALKDLACRFYEANLRRTETLVRGAIVRMQSSGSARGGIEIPLPWAGHAAEILRNEDVGFAQIVPPHVRMEPMLYCVAGIVSAVRETDRPLVDLFSGKKLRSRVKAMLEDSPRLDESVANDWAAAAGALGYRYEAHRNADDLREAEECIARALEADAKAHHALWIRGNLLRLQGRPKEALLSNTRARDLAPRTGNYWRGMALALKDLGRSREARRELVRGIHADPSNMALWVDLGIHLFNHGERRAACYCFARAKEKGDASATQNFQAVCSGTPRASDCPLVLRPRVIRLMNRSFPVWYGWSKLRPSIGAGLRVVVLLLLAAWSYGAFATAPATGWWVGVVGFLALLVASYVPGLMRPALRSVRRRDRTSERRRP
jgi:tetratricopeptide (TPR) repeat protein